MVCLTLLLTVLIHGFYTLLNTPFNSLLNTLLCGLLEGLYTLFNATFHALLYSLVCYWRLVSLKLTDMFLSG